MSASLPGKKHHIQIGVNYKHDTLLYLFFPDSVTETWVHRLFFCCFFSCNQGNQVLYIGMLRHCTVTAVKTNTTLFSCPAGTVWRQDKSGEDRKDTSNPARMGVQWAAQGWQIEHIEVLCKFHHSLFDFEHRDNISPKILFFFSPLESSN